MDKIYLQISLEEYFFNLNKLHNSLNKSCDLFRIEIYSTHNVVIYKTIYVYYLNNSCDSLNESCDQKYI